MKNHSSKLLHVGISLLMAPGVAINQRAVLAFQQAILEQGLEYDKIDASNPNRIVIVRERVSPLSIFVQVEQPILLPQLTVVAPHPKVLVDTFITETEAAARAFEQIFPAKNRQIIRGDATIRRLLETSKDHAFQELWEERLGQKGESLQVFGQPIRGGGLRFVMDPVQNSSDPIEIEVKIESYLQDTSKIFVETIFRWLKPTAPGEGLSISARMKLIDDYMNDQVNQFLVGDQAK